MKKTMLLLAAALLFVSGAKAGEPIDEADLGLFNHLSVGLNVGTTGIGIQAGTCVTKWLGIRAGLDIMPAIKIKPGVDVYYDTPAGEQSETVKLEGNMARTQGEFMVDVYPLGGSFFVTAGMAFGGAKMFEVKGHSDKLASLSAEGVSIPYFDVDKYRVQFDRSGDVRANLEVNKVRPYLGIGFGSRAVPKRRVAFRAELGVQFHGHMKVVSDNVTTLSDYDNENNDISKLVDKLTVYPVLKFCINGRIF